MKNIDESTGISDNSLYFELEIDGTRHSVCFDNYSYPGHHDLVTYMPGGQGYNYYLYTVPTGTGMGGAHIVYTGYDNVTYDPDMF